ncbi:hypothetical protein CC86DRAFT_375876 [Ophiobolus disseminans]|uniref:Tyrosine specific protein phosphatases domain-containing protein n=1 Tax=Ophiobolus disseminans TaxID=1469910 RepID=A0A6A6ZDK0_9PLEO|nr:hypothetical protein CC86DRAFT_375876 [Ophiobolus disseminans]
MTSTSNPPLPSPPFYPIPNINNLRDAALFPLTIPAGPIRPNILFRSADVSKLDRAGWDALHSIGVAHVFDLRSAPEVERGWASTNGEAKDVKPEWFTAMESAGVARSWAPVFGESDYSPEGLAKRYVKYMDEDVKGFVAAYEDILRSGGPAFATIFRYLVNLDVTQEKKQGALVHCSAGKDRTGMFFAILFDYLGVPRQTIAEEYHLTELGLRCIRDEVVTRLMQSPAFKNYVASQVSGRPLSNDEIAKLIADEKTGDVGEEIAFPPEALEKGRNAAIRMVGAKKASMLGALEMLDRVFGGAEKYLREYCGLSDEELAKLRRNLVVGDEEA